MQQFNKIDLLHAFPTFKPLEINHKMCESCCTSCTMNINNIPKKPKLTKSGFFS